MPRALKFVGCLILFIVSFVVFTLWLFPRDAIRSRLITEAEKVLGANYEVQVGDLDTQWLFGVISTNITLLGPGTEKPEAYANVDEVRIRFKPLWFLMGNPRAHFQIKSGKSRIKGKIARTKEGWEVVLDLKNFNLDQFPILKTKWGLNVKSDIDGDLRISLDLGQPLRTTGQATVELEDLQLSRSDVKLGEMGTFSLPELILAKSGSGVQATIAGGALSLENFKMKGGDFNLDLKGKIYLSQRLSGLRMNLEGKFEISPKLGQALSFVMAFVEKQKQADGSYPLRITGPINQPLIKVGALSIPL